MADKDSNSNTAITIAAIGVIGTLGAALIANWDKVFRESPTVGPPAQEQAPRESDQSGSISGSGIPEGLASVPPTAPATTEGPEGSGSQPPNSSSDENASRPQPPSAPNDEEKRRPTPPKSLSLAGHWESDEDKTFIAVADESESGVFELGEVNAAGAGGQKWIAKLDGRDVEINGYAMPSGSHHTRMTLELSLDGNRMDGLAHSVQVDEPAVPVHFRRID